MQDRILKTAQKIQMAHDGVTWLKSPLPFFWDNCDSEAEKAMLLKIIERCEKDDFPISDYAVMDTHMLDADNAYIYFGNAKDFENEKTGMREMEIGFHVDGGIARPFRVVKSEVEYTKNCNDALFYSTYGRNTE